MWLFLDESGDCGFDFKKSKTSPVLVITALVCYSPRILQLFKTSVKRTLKIKLNHKRKRTKVEREMKGGNTTLSAKRYFLNGLQKFPEWEIYSIVVDKRNFKKAIPDASQKHSFYNQVVAKLLLELEYINAPPKVSLVIDRSKHKREQKEFDSYIRNLIVPLLPKKSQLFIDHAASHEDCLIQSVDMFAWGIARKYEAGDTGWYDNFADRICKEIIF